MRRRLRSWRMLRRAQVTLLRVEEEDVFLLLVKEPILADEAAHLCEAWTRAMGTRNQVMVLAGATEIAVVRPVGVTG